MGLCSASRATVKPPETWVGTPVLDLKPYLSSVPADQLRRGWLADAEARRKR
ncbi:MAG TPA: hypothetical protein VH988_14840 [Thermoanaerobaculia bacterium]|jgi:tRNA (Thr-GGU) A37 N-methylase|nr:hypothetical protein [Thermoanaerobaculia bacterium]